jgi:hypothetical protein
LINWLICFILFYFIFYDICFVLFCFVLFCFVLFCYVMLCLCYVMLCYVMLCYVMLCYVLFCFVLFCFVLFCFVWFDFILFLYIILYLSFTYNCSMFKCLQGEACFLMGDTLNIVKNWRILENKSISNLHKQVQKSHNLCIRNGWFISICNQYFMIDCKFRLLFANCNSFKWCSLSCCGFICKKKQKKNISFISFCSPVFVCNYSSSFSLIIHRLFKWLFCFDRNTCGNSASSSSCRIRFYEIAIETQQLDTTLRCNTFRCCF